MSVECGECERDLRGGHDVACSRSATMRLIDQVEHLNATGVIGDGTVAQLHDLAGRARREISPAAGDD